MLLRQALDPLPSPQIPFFLSFLLQQIALPFFQLLRPNLWGHFWLFSCSHITPAPWPVVFFLCLDCRLPCPPFQHHTTEKSGRNHPQRAISLSFVWGSHSQVCFSRSFGSYWDIPWWACHMFLNMYLVGLGVSQGCSDLLNLFNELFLCKKMVTERGVLLTSLYMIVNFSVL